MSSSSCFKAIKHLKHPVYHRIFPLRILTLFIFAIFNMHVLQLHSRSVWTHHAELILFRESLPISHTNTYGADLTRKPLHHHNKSHLKRSYDRRATARRRLEERQTCSVTAQTSKHRPGLYNKPFHLLLKTTRKKTTTNTCLALRRTFTISQCS